MVPSLDAVANELLLLIIRHVEHQWDLLSLARCSRQFYELTLPILYSSITLDALEFRCLRSLLQALLRKPWLAQYVRYLKTTWWFTEEDNMEDMQNFRADWESELLREAVTAASHNQAEEIEWLEAVTVGNADAWVALLLIKLFNVEELDLEIPNCALYPFKVLDRAAERERPFDISPAFASLARISVAWYDDEGGLDCDLVMPLFGLPSLRTFSARMLIDCCTWAPKDSQITEIELTESNGSQGMLGIIGACANLKSLRYEHANKHVFGGEFQIVMLRDALVSTKHSLERLWVDFSPEHNQTRIRRGPNEAIGTMKDFLMLKDIRLRYANLLGHLRGIWLTDILPETLETLYILECSLHDDYLVLQLQLLIHHKEKFTPHLRKIGISSNLYISGCEPGSGGPNRTRKSAVLAPNAIRTTESAGHGYVKFRTTCEAAGIECHVLNANEQRYRKQWQWS
ncbi:hypothetical protein MMC11_002034 [Xylographa trunciseda]|nr:hypothetical protein [Xylographa trunciseda]